jgi:sporulation protein YlmC with PRC-barrel domain
MKIFAILLYPVYSLYMKKIIATLALFSCLITPAFATDTLKAFEEISALNRIDPAQNPQFESAENMLSFNVITSKTKVTARTRDVILAANGKVDSVNVDFKDRNMGQGVYLGFDAMNMRVLGNGFAVGYNEGQIAELMPEILASTATASGEEADTYSLKTMLGAPVSNSEGQHFGHIKTVLFKDQSPQAEAILIELSRNRMIALPFGALKTIPSRSTVAQQKFTLDEGYAQAAQTYLKAR